MDKSQLIKKLFSKKNKDYTYAIAFFFILSFFIFYIIRPNLTNVFEINTKIEQLKKINKLYADQIDKIVQVQSSMENNRDGLVLLREAFAQKPEVNKVLSDVDVTTGGGELRSERIAVSDINLKDKGSVDKLKSFIINMNLIGSYEDTLAFIRKIYNQRRLKLAPVLELTREEEASESATLNIKLEVEGYYL